MQRLILVTLKILIVTNLVGTKIQPVLAVTRSTGIGFRGNYWNISHRGNSVNIQEFNNSVTTDVSGVGGSIYFFSRVKDNWFLELNFGAVTAVKSEVQRLLESDTEVSTITPLLFGFRYDILSARLPGTFQPYLGFGSGPYINTFVMDHQELLTSTQTIESHIKYGGYLGGGMNVMITDWFALNFDTKYHFYDFDRKNMYSGLEFGLGFSFMWGRKQEIFDIKELKVIVQDIYPTFYQFYSTYPLALLTIKNVAGYPIEVNVTSFIKGFSERPQESGFIRLQRRETKDIPITAILSSRLKNVVQRETAILDLEIEARAGAVHRREFSAQLMVHHRNAWDGDMEKLIFFITPENEQVLKIIRKITRQIQLNANDDLFNFEIANAIFNELMAFQIHYQRDPNIPFYQDDRVQFADETLRNKSGDCDDLTVLYASLLESAGIHTSFVEVQDPEKEIAHLYVMFDTGLEPAQGHLLSSNEKRYVVRDSAKGPPTIWVPVETTLITRGFSDAWSYGATAYLKEGTLRGGLASGWMKLIDIQ